MYIILTVRHLLFTPVVPSGLPCPPLCSTFPAPALSARHTMHCSTHVLLSALHFTTQPHWHIWREGSLLFFKRTAAAGPGAGAAAGESQLAVTGLVHPSPEGRWWLPICGGCRTYLGSRLSQPLFLPSLPIIRDRVVRMAANASAAQHSTQVSPPADTKVQHTLLSSVPLPPLHLHAAPSSPGALPVQRVQ